MEVTAVVPQSMLARPVLLACVKVPHVVETHVLTTFVEMELRVLTLQLCVAVIRVQMYQDVLALTPDYENQRRQTMAHSL